MSEQTSKGRPYLALGLRLKSAREQLRQSAAEVSGAVEIDENVLGKIERGEQRPSEAILMLLISHLGLQDDDATTLWEMAGYQRGKDDFAHQTSTFDLGQPVAMVMPMDLRVVYTDRVHVMVNNYGVIMNFMQGAGPNNQPLAVARIGMSKEHARSVLHVLQETLSQADKQDNQKRLPPYAKG